MITVFKYVKTCSKGESKCFFMAKERRINGFKGNLEQTLAKKKPLSISEATSSLE